MKKPMLSLAVLMGLTSAAHAQSGFRIGLKGGANLASFTGTDKKDTKSKYGFSAGATFNFPLSDLISIQPELLYSQKGAKLDYSGSSNSDASVFKNSNSVSGTFGQTLSYIDVPLLVRVNTGGSDGSGLFFEFGPQGSFLIAQRGFIDSGDKATVVLMGDQRNNANASPTPTSLPAVAVGTSTDDFNKVVVGYAVGLGYQLTNGLSLNVRYSGDISQVYKDGMGTADAYKPYQAFGSKFTNPNLHNSVFQLQAGYAFGGK
ncbi:porin family protein [Hymenobacter convexus]|uniref:porin family protein n=1 Tax=Hymenobacter sp. CA1UV-4 TaxID=3063782 RepID=UPI002712A114|nr:porin family protein [Hymenobacter sp. CA1UV-4]MDO7854020.1 porin family protein [Hymenobacter sp. CA1UV-4]